MSTHIDAGFTAIDREICLPVAKNASGALAGTWVDVSDLEGGVTFHAAAGVATAGSTPTVSFKVQDATSSAGAGAADVSGGSLGAAIDTSSVGGRQRLTLAKTALRRFVNIVATLSSGETVPISACVSGQKKIT